MESGDRIKTFIRHSSDFPCVVFSPNGEYLASGSTDCTIGMWRLSSGECVKTFFGYSNQVSSVVFSLNKYYLVSGSDDYTIGVWSG